MKLTLDLDGIIVQLCIRGYISVANRLNDGSDDWCGTDFSFSSPPWLDYHKENDEVFMHSEVDELAAALGDLLNDRLLEPQELMLMEPDFCFKLNPKEDLRNNPRVLYIQPGHEIVDISMEWRVSFWHDGLTANYLSVALNREEIINLRNYLLLVSGKVNESAPEIITMMNDGILIK